MRLYNLLSLLPLNEMITVFYLKTNTSIMQKVSCFDFGLTYDYKVLSITHTSDNILITVK